MEKLNLERNREDFYVLEVNDKGDTIVFDLTDVNLPKKILDASENIEKKDKEYKYKVVELSEKYKDDKISLTKETINLEIEHCMLMRKEFDNFLGDGACQKIFGDTNYYGMFIKLFEALEEHFEKMKINMQKAKRKLADKYVVKEKEVI